MKNYRRKKPDLQALYKQKENDRIECKAEMEECLKLIDKAVQTMKDTLLAYPNDLDEIQKTAKFCVLWMNKRIEERQFRKLTRFDIGQMWDFAILKLRRLYGTR